MITNKIKMLILLLPACLSVFAQKKATNAAPVSGKIVIDGMLNEDDWASAGIADRFIMLEPDNNKPEDSVRKTVVRILYDNDAIYFGAVMYDDPKTILREIALRDNFVTADHFGVFINGYNDGQQDFRFFVSAAGTQSDCLATTDNEDYSWDAIWYSAVKITDYGWVAEMKIPYAALRFPESPDQKWGLNIYREIRKFRQKLTWNLIDRNIGSSIVQNGLLEGIHNIKPPTRLFFIPYTSYYYSSNDLGTSSTVKGGMDIKYGINDSFTLDAILVPDFGQAAFDAVELNLGPFEQQFNENRPFFTEGTDMFNKAGLLYTRRIGGAPSTYPATGENEEVTVYPGKTDLLNAIKISGRTKSGLGIGVMNAVTQEAFATVRNTATGQERDVMVEPLANYNVAVLDQRFNKNSSVSLINTNVTRNGGFRDANVSALVYNLNTKANTYNLSGDFKFSAVNDLQDKTGTSAYLSAGKTSGKYRYNAAAFYVSKDFDINDMGIIFRTNYYNLYANGSYRIMNPTKHYNSFTLNLNAYSEFHTTTGKLQTAYLEASLNSTTRKNDFWGYELQIKPYTMYDFYEPRVDGRYVKTPAGLYAYMYYSSNYNRPFAIDIQPDLWLSTERNRNYYGLYISPRYRFSNRFQMVYSMAYGLDTSNKGWVAFDGDNVVFTERDRTTMTSTLTGKYSVNNKMTINLTARHYYTYGENLRYFTLGNDGGLTENTTFTTNKDFTYNNWNFDLSYTWWFAPGSQISVLYRNNAVTSRDYVSRNYRENLEGLFKNNLNSMFSVSLRYFIDYNAVKNWI